MHEHAQLRDVIQRANASDDKQMYTRTRSDVDTPGAQSVVLRDVIQRANASNDKQMYTRTRSDEGAPGAQSVVAACGALVPL